MIDSIERYLAEGMTSEVFSAEIDLLEPKDPAVAVVG